MRAYGSFVYVRTFCLEGCARALETVGAKRSDDDGGRATWLRGRRDSQESLTFVLIKTERVAMEKDVMLAKEGKTIVSAENAPGITRSDQYRAIYVDSSKLGYSPWDIRLTFGLLIEELPNKIVNQEQVTIILSPGHGKTLLRILQEQIPMWEKQFGEIRDPLAPENIQVQEAEETAQG